MQLFLLLAHLRGHHRVINWPNSNIVAHGIGRCKGGGDGRMLEPSEHSLSIRFTVLYGCALWHP